MSYFINLSESIKPFWPSDLIETDFSLLDKIWIEPFMVESGQDSIGINSTLLFEVPLEFKVPFVDSVSFSIGGDGLDVKIPFSALFHPSFALSIGPITFVLHIESNLLVPVEKEVGSDGTVSFLRKEETKTSIQFGAITFYFELDGSFDLNIESQVSLPPTMIGNSGVVVEASNFVPIFSGNQSDAIPSSLPSDWRGVYLEEATIYLPQDISVVLPSDIQLDDFFIGNGGFSGKIAGNWTPLLSSDGKSFTGNGAGELCGIPFGLKNISLEFKQNSFVESSLHGTMILPFFDGPIDVEVCLANDGDFAVNIFSSSGGSLIKLTRENLLELSVQNIGFAYQDDLFSVTLGGKIKPLFGGIDWPEVDIKALTIDSDGNVKVDGGWIEVPRQLAMDFNGFKLELTKIGFGKEDDGSKWVGMSGGINIVEGIPLKGGVDGLKLIWRPDDTFGIEISGINVAFEIEDVLLFDGKVYFIDEPYKKGFKGGIKMILYPLDGMMIDAQFIAGKNTLSPAYNFFYIFIGIELPVGIPLGATGASLYGMAGLFGYNMTVDKSDTEAWFENDDGSDGFYKRSPEGISAVEKWTDTRDALAFGAGITLGTASDNGFTFNGRVLLVILIPGPVILIEGKGTFLKERSKIDEPDFKLLAVLDCNAATFLLNIEAQFKYPDDGCVVDVGGMIEVFFNFNNPNSWHLYFGQDSPESKRIRATIFSLFRANYYLMIDSSMFEMGTWMGYKNKWEFGTLSVKLEAWMEAILGMSYEPVQAWGSITLNGDVQLKAFGVGFGLSVYAFLGATTPDPWWIKGELKVKLNLPWPLPDPEAEITLEWREDRVPPTPLPLGGFGIEHLKVTEKWELDPGTGFQNSPVVPLDAKPILNFSKAVEDAAFVGDNLQPAPSAEHVDEYRFKYRLTKIILKKKAKNSSSAWVTVAEKSESSSSSGSLLFGQWMVLPEEPGNTKLMLWANTPFDICRELESNHTYLMTTLHNMPGYPCNIDTEPQWICVDFDGMKVGYSFIPVLVYQNLLFYSEFIPMELVPNSSDWMDVSNILEFKMPEFATDTEKSGFYATINEVMDSGLTFTDEETGSGGDYGTIRAIASVVSDDIRELEENKLDLKSSQFMSVIFPDEMGIVELYLSCGSYGEVKARDNNGNLVDHEEFDFRNIPDDEMKPVIIYSKSESFKKIIIHGEFGIGRICTLTKDEETRVNTNENIIRHHKSALEERWGEHAGAMLEPNHYYKLEVFTETLRKKGSGSWTTFEHSDHVYFQTGNPPGAYESPGVQTTGSNGTSEMEPTNESEHYPERGPLRDLSPYIEATIPAGHVSNEAQLPVYRSYDVGVIFNEGQGYVEQMYLMADLPLTIRLFDNNDLPVLNIHGQPVILQNAWGDNPQLYLTKEDQQWRQLLNENCAMEFEETDHHTSATLISYSDQLVLKPQTLYRAKLFAGDEFIVYNFSFISSRFCTFLHHIHSFNNVLWDLNTLDQIMSLELDELNGYLNEVTGRGRHLYIDYQKEIEAKAYEDIMNSNCIDLGIRQLPDNVEISTINDDEHIFGLLLESPEPLDWNRIDISLKMESHSVDISGTGPTGFTIDDLSPEMMDSVDALITGPGNNGSGSGDSVNEGVVRDAPDNFKIINASIVSEDDRDENYNEEFIDILVRKRSDLSGMKILIKKPDEDEFQDHYIFGAEEVFPDGMLIRIHSGQEDDENDGETGMIHRYITPEDGESDWKFNLDGGIIQCADQTGKVSHEFLVESVELSDLQTKIVRNKDQTRTLIFAVDNNGNHIHLNHGKCLLEFIFRSDIGDNKPLLRLGQPLIEKADLRFRLL